MWELKRRHGTPVGVSEGGVAKHRASGPRASLTVVSEMGGLHLAPLTRCVHA